MLTGLPLPGPRDYSPATLVGSLFWFPIVGALLGALLGAAELGARSLSGSHAISCAGVVAAGLLCTRGSHLQGLMNVLGALFSGRDRERVAELSARRIPTAFGTLGGIAAVLLRYALLLAAPAGARLWLLIAATGLSRSAITWACWRFGYAELDTGIGSYLSARAGPRDLLLVLPVIGVAFGALGPIPAATLLAAVWAASHLFAIWVSRLAGGLTASTYEAIAEIGDLAALASFASLAQAGQT